VSTITDSILDSIKKVLQIDPANEDFDTDIIMHINSVFSILDQLGVGPSDGFMIEDNTTVWADFLSDAKPLNLVQSYMWLRVRLLFDPPSTSYGIEAQERQMRELEWRINLYRESLLDIVVIT
jgi:hypothetical protein